MIQWVLKDKIVMMYQANADVSLGLEEQIATHVLRDSGAFPVGDAQVRIENSLA